MSSARTIYCPNCHRKVGSYDGKSTMNKYIECRKCKKMICFYPENNAVEVKDIPKRVTSSGMTFI